MAVMPPLRYRVVLIRRQTGPLSFSDMCLAEVAEAFRRVGYVEICLKDMSHLAARVSNVEVTPAGIEADVEIPIRVEIQMGATGIEERIDVVVRLSERAEDVDEPA